MTAPAAVSWAVYLGWLPLQNSALAFLGYVVAPYIFTLLAIGELIADQLPKTPSRKVPVQFGARIVSGALCGAAIGAAGGALAGELVAGVVGAAAGKLAAITSWLDPRSFQCLAQYPYSNTGVPWWMNWEASQRRHHEPSLFSDSRRRDRTLHGGAGGTSTCAHG
jgi:hypothetical protein